MTRWKQFEKSVFEFLKIEFSDFHFEAKGENNANKPAIKTYKDGKFLFNIEVKHSTAEVGHITLLLEEDRFVFSPRKNNPQLKNTKTFIKYLNSNFSHFSSVKTQNMPIDVEQKIIFSFIKKQYEEKNTPWIIASKKVSDLKMSDLCLVPLKDIDKYFSASVGLTRKRSGPRLLSNSKLNEAKKEILKICNTPKIEKIGTKYYLYGKIEMDLLIQNGGKESQHGLTLSEDIFLSKKGTDKYEIKLMGQDTNPNIIFRLNPNKKYHFQKDSFLNFINSKIY